MEQNQDTSLFGLTIDANSKSHLGEAARWAKFLAIVGFVVCALIVLVGIFAGSIFSSMMGSRYGGEDFGDSNMSITGLGPFLSVFYIGMALLYFFPCLFLYRFATHMKKALAGGEQEILNKSFQNLKAMFRFVGILTIIILTIYAIILLMAIIMGATGGF